MLEASVLNELDKHLLRRAFSLALRAAPSAVEPNPPVGAVIAVGDRIIGEGYHQAFGGPHAEIVALQTIQDPELLPHATLYVTLEPCCHTEKKTPPCVPAILQAGIRRIVVGTVDPNPAVSGKGIMALQAAGTTVVLSDDSRPFRRLLRHFHTNLRFRRPYITLKWAQTLGPTGRFPFAGGVIGSRRVGQWPISSFWGRVWGHKLRAAHSHIAVGYRTYTLDKPTLSTRYYPGASPHPIVFYDPRRGIPTLSPPVRPFPLSEVTPEVLQKLYEEFHVGSLLVEGGAKVLQQFLSAGLYDEVHILLSHTATPPPPNERVEAPLWPSLSWRRRHLSPSEEVWIGRPSLPQPIPSSQTR